ETDTQAPSAPPLRMASSAKSRMSAGSRIPRSAHSMMILLCDLRHIMFCSNVSCNRHLQGEMRGHDPAAEARLCCLCGGPVMRGHWDYHGESMGHWGSLACCRAQCQS